MIDALGDSLKGGHVGLVTGLKHYLGPFDAYGKGAVPMTPFREEQGRQPVDNFYYAQEDEVFAGAEKYGYSWSVHRPHTIIGFALGNAMNMGQTLAVYASRCKQTGQPFVFPGSKAQWEGVTDMTDAHILAQQLEWAATTPSAQDQDYNVVNGDVFRWKWMWGEIASYFGIEAAPFPGRRATAGWAHGRGSRRVAGAGEAVQPEGSGYQQAGVLVAYRCRSGPSDGSVYRHQQERKAGFTGYQSTRDAFFALFDKLKAEKLIPS